MVGPMEGGGEVRKEHSQTPPPSPGLKKGPWTAEEDAILIEHVRNHGEGNWNSVQKTTALARCGKSCRLRWANHLRPNLKKGQLTPEEELIVLRLHAHVGNKWARMAAQLPGRTDNEIKNYWNTRVKRRQRAGLPLYPPSLLQWHRPPPLVIPSSSSVSPSPPGFAGGGNYNNFFSPRTPSMKRAREEGFNFPVMAPAVGMPRMWHTAPSTPTGATMFDYSIMPSLSPPPMLPSGYCARSAEVNSGGAELMDRLLQEAERREVVVSAGYKEGEWFDWSDTAFGDQLEGKEGNVGDHKGFLGGLDCTNGTISTMQETNPFAQDDILVSDLLEMTPTQPMPTHPDWNNSDNSDMSNGGQSVLTNNDDLSLDLHNLAASFSIAPNEQEWNMQSCHWSNVPELV